MILDGHNCVWLMQYPHEALAGGSMYAVLMPAVIPPAGAAGGPPPPSGRRLFFAGPAGTDMREMFLGLIRHPETMPDVMAKMKADFAKASARPAP
jgi:hypothetical protein